MVIVAYYSISKQVACYSVLHLAHHAGYLCVLYRFVAVWIGIHVLQPFDHYVLSKSEHCIEHPLRSPVMKILNKLCF